MNDQQGQDISLSAIRWKRIGATPITTDEPQQKNASNETGKCAIPVIRMVEDNLVFYVPFNIIEVTSRRWENDDERLCAIKKL